MAWIIDIILLLVLLICMRYCYSKGLLYTVFMLVSFVVAFLLAFICAKAFAPQLSHSLIEPRMEETVAQRLQQLSIPDLSGALQEQSEALQQLLQQFGLDPAVLQEVTSGDALQSTLIQTASQRIAFDILFVITFFVVKVILYVLSKALGIVDKLPLIHGANHLLGGLLGLALGLVVVFGLAVLIDCFSLLLSEKLPKVFVSGFTEKTYLYRFLLDVWGRLSVN